MVGRRESVKQATLRGHKRSAGSSGQSKCAKSSHQTNDCVLVEEDFEVVASREGRIDSHGAPVASSRSPQKGRITWTGQKSWNADGIMNNGVSSMPGTQDTDDELAMPVNIPLPKPKKKWSKKSVRSQI